MILARVSRSLASRRRRSSRYSSSWRAVPVGPAGTTAASKRRGGGRADLLGDSAGDDLAQHRVQPAGRLATQPGQVAMPLGPHLQHRRMIIRGDRPPDRGAQRRDGHGPGIVRVALARPAVRQQPDPRPELRLEIDDALASRQQLLGQQMPLPGRALHRPGPLRPARSPPRQLRRLATLVRTRSLPSWVSAASIATAVCDPLCGSIPMITAATNGPFPPHAGIRRPRRAPLISDRPGVRTAFEPRRDRTRQTGNSLTSQAAARGRQSRTEPARRVPGRYGKSPAVPARHTIRAVRGRSLVGSSQRWGC